MTKETMLEMAIRHLAQQEARIAKQRALIARMSDHGLPITDATNLLASMETLRRQIRDELNGLTKKRPRDQ
jgi:hypothetical protein